MQDFIALALSLAQQSLLLSSPNPHVGCVLTSAEGRLLGQGFTQRAGAPHAEIMALRDAQAQGHSLLGATAYVTLEPCSHQGRTGPCCDALIAAGIKKVVASLLDPNPLVGGQGFARLRAAGITVEVGPGAVQSRELNIGFFSRMLRRTPWVRLKLAASLDGKTALESGASQWLTSEEARSDGHAWRARSCAVLTGLGTVLADDPQLDVRLVPTERQPQLVLLDNRLETPLGAKLFKVQRTCHIYTASQHAGRRVALEALGARVCQLPGTDQRVDLVAMLRDLADHEINELHVEAGAALNGALLAAGLVDEIVLYLAPKMIGKGRDMASFGPLSALSEALALEFISSDRLGPDLRLVARIAGRDRF
ncbi:MAG: bifunctional diaminohydroxyphosphoribosylaminopyrimidine deaminase/5-amino-6-(5-phosphoribosylamino)uracil reductase RibD [Comamonadaceae bacterium]|nr:MAG: bifunctional diaminohydroxyphosphoribosylaminopyrimidine deaminase/5-amino-6-(5-phosphoribosylamino)uracil reductase RibD [Comamonadaceae bacterium]